MVELMEIFLEPFLFDLKFWATQNKDYFFFLGFFSSIKFLWLLFIYQIVELKKNKDSLYFACYL